MASDESWKGEHFIRGMKVDPEAQRLDGLRVTSKIWHKKRRMKGKEAPAAYAHNKFYQAMFRGRKRDA